MPDYEDGRSHTDRSFSALARLMALVMIKMPARFVWYKKSCENKGMRNLTIATVLLSASFAVEATAAGPDIAFNDDIRPILSEYCFACHGPDTSSRKAELRLDVRESATAEGVIVPGNAEKSELIVRIMSDDPDVVMPPPDAKKKLKPEHKRLLARWIESGAAWQQHWSFITPRKSELPRPDGIRKWARNPIDHFVLDKLRQLRLQPNGLADRHTLARRAALDLTGLPPHEELVATFLLDESGHQQV